MIHGLALLIFGWFYIYNSAYPYPYAYAWGSFNSVANVECLERDIINNITIAVTIIKNKANKFNHNAKS